MRLLCLIGHSPSSVGVESTSNDQNPVFENDIAAFPSYLTSKELFLNLNKEKQLF